VVEKISGEHMVLAALEHGIFSTWISSMDCELVGETIGIKGFVEITNQGGQNEKALC